MITNVLDTGYGYSTVPYILVRIIYCELEIFQKWKDEVQGQRLHDGMYDIGFSNI